MMEAYEVLEHEWATFCGCPNTVSCSSGTAALHLALEALQLPPGSQVIVPEFTMVACARAVTMAGHVPTFVDCGHYNDGLMDWVKAANAMTDKTKAIMAVHVYGRKSPSVGIGKDLGRLVIEDLAEAHGVKQHPQTDAACWSFYKNKIVAGEEGGMVAFKDPAHAALARQLRSLGFTDSHDFTHIPRGHNYRMSNAHAQLVLKSLSWYEENVADRRQIEQWYDEYIPRAWHMPARDAVWVYDLRISSMTRDKQNTIVNALNSCGIACRHAFKPMSSQTEYYLNGIHDITKLNAYRLSREVIYLPVVPGMAEADVARYAKTLVQAASAVGLAP